MSITRDQATERIVTYFTEGVGDYEFAETVGVEVETQFIDSEGKPISVETSQRILSGLLGVYPSEGWRVTQWKHDLITEVASPRGDRVFYELARHNLEVSSAPIPMHLARPSHWDWGVREILGSLYNIARVHLVSPRTVADSIFEPVLPEINDTGKDLLIIPDERDAAWLELDGREALNLLARCSSVQFTIDVPLKDAIVYLNKLGASLDRFLANYPQEKLWRRYIRESHAGYDPLRYGGPLSFDSIEDYCRQLVKQDVVVGSALVPHTEVENLDVSLFVRSVWWYFRLKRYGNKLCIEVRPLARREDSEIKDQLEMVMNILTS